MPQSRLLFVMACAAALACQPAEMTRSEALRYEQQLEGLVDSWVTFSNNAAVDSILAMYDQSESLVVVRTDGSVARGFEAEEEALRGFYGRIQYMNFVLQSPSTELLSANTAVTTFGHSTDVVGNNGRRRPVMAGRGTIIWVRDEGADTWKIHLLHLAADADTPS